MQLVLDRGHVQGRRGPLLQLGGFALSTGECVLLAGEPGQGHTALALVLTGRLSPYTGQVRLVRDDGTQSIQRKELRRRSAVVDLPAVSEPFDAIRVGTVTAEDLALSRRVVWPRTPRTWLSSHRLATLERKRVDTVPGPVRTALLTALAVERKSVRFLVLSLPDRHGGDPSQWWAIAQAYAAVGYGVLVQCGLSSARDLGATLPPPAHGSDQRTTPLEAMRLRPSPEPRQPPGTAPPPTGDVVNTTWLSGSTAAGGKHREPPAPPRREQAP
ncbi:ATP-binding cassette domain-containing protein [Nocardioides sp. zg-DK7169]|uniref:ATP-binding cassette domain-containing protein n=1 Tax=Nocardioides sp. zg-DK7169 TaxID=2736600 RepID=UPI00155171B0|nr:ATP-binding cassette domain-containing protein [Nocardioides sp. zg-DK7169]NPC96655.1 ATP-binding cassette domain-containing protein [Nocardioides sp. zg-DK7169]